MFSSPFPEENDNAHAGSITLTDDKGRSLECYVEHSLEVDEQEYVLLSSCRLTCRNFFLGRVMVRKKKRF